MIRSIGTGLALVALQGCSSPTASLASGPAPDELAGRPSDEKLAELMRDARAREIDWWGKHCEPEPAPGFICLQADERPERPRGKRYRAEFRSAASRQVGGKWHTVHRLVLELAD
jgi:hypothetical protein